MLGFSAVVSSLAAISLLGLLSITGCKPQSDETVSENRTTSTIALTNGGTTTLSPHGGTGGNAGSLSCPASQVIVGLFGQYSGTVYQLGVICREMYDTSLLGTASYRSPILGTKTGTAFEIVCPNAKVANGLIGGAGSLLDRIGLSCGTPNDPSVGTVQTSAAGGTGGSAFVDSCPSSPASYLSGLKVRSGSKIDQVKGVCLRPLFNPTTYLPARGGTGGTAGSFDCPDSQVIVGVFGQAADTVYQMGVRCREVLPSGIFGSNEYTSPIQGTKVGTAFDLRCPDGQAATGLAGGAGQLLDRVGLQCGTLNDPNGATKLLTSSAGGTGGGAYADSCPTLSAYYLTRIKSRSGSKMDQIQGVCTKPYFNPLAYVITTRGTNNGITPSGSYWDFSRGKTFPATAVPFGFNFWTPSTRGDSSDILYEWDHSKVEAFSISHQPSPQIQDYSMLQFMPMINTVKTVASERAADFKHADEIARAHYYSLKMGNGIRVEMTPTDHAGVMRFTFPANDKAYVLIDNVTGKTGVFEVDVANSVVKGSSVDGKGTMYFYGKFSLPIQEWSTPSSTDAATWARFSVPAQGVLTLSLATSFISVDQAQSNLAAEVGSKTFDQVRADAEALWSKAFGRIAVEGAADSQLSIFYSSLYRSQIYPNSRWESVSGQAKYMSSYSSPQALKDGVSYVNNGTWDTARSEWQLLMLLEPTQTGRMLDGYVNSYRDGSWTPRWTGPGYLDVMLGTHTDIIFADAYLKGVRGFDTQLAYESMLRNSSSYSSTGSKGRKKNNITPFVGYMPTELMNDSLGWHLEDNVADYGISLMAGVLGKEADAAYYLNKAQSYANVFSPSVGFFRGRKADGTWRTSDADFKPNEWGYEYSQGNAYHYAAAGNHDPRGVINLYGGDEAFIRKLDSVWEAPAVNLLGSNSGKQHAMYEMESVDLGQYAHANEPVHHMAYMYNYAGMPAKAALRVRKVLDEATGQYTVGLADGGGYVGDEDNGAMSAWYVFSALGFYPASPGHPEYTIGSPLFTKATLNLENGKTFVVSAPGNSASNIYIQSATLNGLEFSRNYLTHDEILAGGTLVLNMGSSGESAWGRDLASRPHSVAVSSASPLPLVDVANLGTVASSGENPPNEVATAAFDNNSLTKWLARSNKATLQYKLPAKRAVTFYTLTSANDAPGRDPKDWNLEGSNDGMTWAVLASETAQTWKWRYQTQVYKVSNPATYQYYRLNILSNNGDSFIQLAEVELLGRDNTYASVMNSASGLCLEISGASLEAGASLVQAACNGSSGQGFALIPVAGGFSLQNQNSGLCATGADGSQAIGSLLVQATCNGSTAQVFNLIHSGLGNYLLRTSDQGACIANAGSSAQAGDSLILGSCDGTSPSKIWQLR